MLPQEQVFYQDLTVKISRTQAVFEATTCPISRISEVKVFTALPRGMGVIFLLMLVGLILALIFYLTWLPIFAYLMLGSAVAEVVAGIILVVIHWKPVCCLKITTTYGGEFIAVRSKDVSYIKIIAKAINRAKTSPG